MEIFHAGTARQGRSVVTAGGRVLSVCARGASIEQAAERAYAAVELVQFEGMQYRHDIGWRARER